MQNEIYSVFLLIWKFLESHATWLGTLGSLFCALSQYSHPSNIC